MTRSQATNTIRPAAGDRVLSVIFYVLTGIFAFICLLPIILAISSAFSDEVTITMNGYALWPQNPSLDTFRYLWDQKGYQMLGAYGMSVAATVVGTVIACAVTLCYAYVCALPKFRHANFFSFFAYFTMLFNGGMLAWYLLCTNYYKLSNTLWALTLPIAMNPFNMYLMRNYFKTIPAELYESARVDGAGQMRTFLQIMLPLSQIGLITIALFYGIAYWNDFYLPLMLIHDESMFTVQYLLYRMMSQLTFLSTSGNSQYASHITPPVETARMAMTVIALGPIVLVYPFIQRYFMKGIILGALKG